MFRLASLILRNVTRNKRRSLLTLASMILSLALLTLMISLYYGLFLDESSNPVSARRIITRHKVSLVQDLPLSYRERVRSLSGVDSISSTSWFGGTYREPKDFFARFAADPDTIMTVQGDFTLPPDQLEAFKRTRSGAIASDSLAKKFNWKLGEKIIIRGDIYPVDLDLTLVGIFQHPPNVEVFYFNREYLTELLKAKGRTDAERIGTMTILAKSPDDVPRLSRAIDEMFNNSPSPTRTESEKEFSRGFLSMIGNVRLFITALGAAVTFTILLVSANTIAMSVRERTREIAILRTLGYAPGEIVSLVLGESLLLAIVGGGMGLGLGALLSKAMMPILGNFGYQGMAWQAAAASLVLAALIGLVASLIPALIASRKDIVPSLRFTG